VWNAADNASAAVAIYKQQGLTAWQTYTNGAYKGFLSGGTTPDTNVPGAGATATDTSAQAAPSNCIVLVPNPVSGVPIIGSLITSKGICLFTKTEARALIGGVILAAGASATLVGLAILVVSGFSHTKAGQAAGRAVGGAAEITGAGLALAGMPEVGAPIAAAGGAVRSHSRARSTQAGGYARRSRTRARQNTAEDSELQARGATDISTARKPPGTLTKNRPGRVTESRPGPRARQRPPTRAEAGF
jgi:hypothetical protein